MLEDIGAIKAGAGSLCQLYAKYRRTQAKQENIEDQPIKGKRDAETRRCQIATLETERASLEIELEYALLDMLCAMGFIDDEWQRIRAQQVPLKKAIAGLLE